MGWRYRSKAASISGLVIAPFVSEELHEMPPWWSFLEETGVQDDGELSFDLSEWKVGFLELGSGPRYLWGKSRELCWTRHRKSVSWCPTSSERLKSKPALSPSQGPTRYLCGWQLLLDPLASSPSELHRRACLPNRMPVSEHSFAGWGGSSHAEQLLAQPGSWPACTPFRLQGILMNSKNLPKD